MWLMSPLSWLLLAVLLAPLAWRFRPRTVWPWRIAVAVVLVAITAMTPMVANTLAGYLERPVPAAASCSELPPSTVVVLAGGRDRKPRAVDDFSGLNAASRRRMDRGIRYWRADPSRLVVVSGGQSKEGAMPHADSLVHYARWMGVPEVALRAEDQSPTTWHNARRVAALAPPVGPRIVLVTSALHMRRAAYAFDKAGFEVCPMPTDWSFIPFGLPGYLIPQTSALVKTEMALHELVGLAYYRWLNWRDESIRGI